MRYTYRDQNQKEEKQVYLGVAFVHGDRQQVVNPIQTLETLEYELVRAVHVLTVEKEDEKVVALLQGNGEPDLNALLAVFRLHCIVVASYRSSAMHLDALHHQPICNRYLRSLRHQDLFAVNHQPQ